MISPEPGCRARTNAAAVGWADLIMICGKCMRRESLTDLRAELQKALRHRSVRDFSVIECGCLNVCSKEGITVARSGDYGSDPSRLHVFHRDDGVATLCNWVLSNTPR